MLQLLIMEIYSDSDSEMMIDEQHISRALQCVQMTLRDLHGDDDDSDSSYDPSEDDLDHDISSLGVDVDDNNLLTGCWRNVRDDGIYFQVTPEYYNIPLFAPHRNELTTLTPLDSGSNNGFPQLLIKRISPTVCRVVLEGYDSQCRSYTLFDHQVGNDIAETIYHELISRHLDLFYQGPCFE